MKRLSAPQKKPLNLQLPPGVHPPKTATPAIVKHLPPQVHDLYVRAFDASLHPVFVVGAFIAGFAFALTWLLQEKPLRKTTEGLMEAV